jgi:hypothetical protein
MKIIYVDKVIYIDAGYEKCLFVVEMWKVQLIKKPLLIIMFHQCVDTVAVALAFFLWNTNIIY